MVVKVGNARGGMLVQQIGRWYMPLMLMWRLLQCLTVERGHAAWLLLSSMMGRYFYTVGDVGRA
jgi:hypothetical protein